MTKVLFVCEGNMIRSPMAEGFYNHYTGTHDAKSAGAGVTLAEEEASSGPFPDVVAAMHEKSIDISDSLRQRVTDAMVRGADIIVTFPTPMMPESIRNNPKTEHWDISDPYYMPDDGQNYIERARDQIDVRAKELIERTKA